MAEQKRSLIIGVTDREKEVFDQLCQEQELSKDAMFRQMLRHYQLVHQRLKNGERMTFSGDRNRWTDFFSIDTHKL